MFDSKFDPLALPRCVAPSTLLPAPGVRRRAAAVALLAAGLSACGGGGPGTDAGPMAGRREQRTLRARVSGNDYLISVYLPPDSAGPRASMPVIYLLDGESWFDTMVGIVAAGTKPVIVVGIAGMGLRQRDFVPASNTCTSGGGGQEVYWAFLRQEVLPYIESNFGGDPAQRALFGHSHGGSFVLYALFSQAPQDQAFKTYLASDSSIPCMPATLYGWESAYAAAHRDLPLRLHLSWASAGNQTDNAAFAAHLESRRYNGLALRAQRYEGSHNSIVPAVLADGIVFAF